MKRKLQLFFTMLVMSVVISNAQVINPGFEIWTSDVLAPSAMNPNAGNNTYGWWNFNYFNNTLMGASPISVTRCSDTVRTGLYSARIETKVYTPASWNTYKLWGIPFIGHEYNDTLGILFNGKVNVNDLSFAPGTSCTQILSQFKFYYQYKPQGNDTAECRVELLSGGIPVAGGWFKTGAATGASGWQQATIDFTYVNALTPDTLWIIFSSSSFDYKPHAGSVLWIDDASVSFFADMEQPMNEENNLIIYPNPSNGIVSIQPLIGATEKTSIEIFNLSGALIYSAKTDSEETFQIDISDSPKGIYFVKLYNGKSFVCKKLCKE